MFDETLKVEPARELHTPGSRKRRAIRAKLRTIRRSGIKRVNVETRAVRYVENFSRKREAVFLA